MPTPVNHFHRRRIGRLHQEHRRGHPIAARARWRRNPLDGINPERLDESEIIVGKLAQTLGGKARVKTYTNQSAR